MRACRPHHHALNGLKGASPRGCTQLRAVPPNTGQGLAPAQLATWEALLQPGTGFSSAVQPAMSAFGTGLQWQEGVECPTEEGSPMVRACTCAAAFEAAIGDRSRRALGAHHALARACAHVRTHPHTHPQVVASVPMEYVLSACPSLSLHAARSAALQPVFASDTAWEIKLGAALLWSVQQVRGQVLCAQRERGSSPLCTDSVGCARLPVQQVASRHQMECQGSAGSAWCGASIGSGVLLIWCCSFGAAGSAGAQPTGWLLATLGRAVHAPAAPADHRADVQRCRAAAAAGGQCTPFQCK